MNNIVLLTESLEYIESNLTSPIKTEDVAAACFCSKSTVEKLFKVLHISVRDYIIRRRMSLAAKEIAANPNISLIDLALKYGYSSHEAFTRAFKGVWHVSPSEYKKNPAKFELFPGFKVNPEFLEDDFMKTRRQIDISELYDLITERRGNYLIASDIKSLLPINNIAFEAGDIAIITAMERLDSVCGENDILFRVGGDEFVVLTASDDIKYVEKMMEDVMALNGKEFKYESMSIPLSLYCTCFKLEAKPIKYAELFSMVQKELDVAKKDCK